MGCCPETSCAAPASAPRGRWRRVLIWALLLNGGMFAAEIVAGVASGSASLQADALDFFGDSANYAISLSVAGLALGWRARAALIKGWTIALFGIGVLASAAWHLAAGTVPEAQTMGAVGVIALLVNALVAWMLFHFRDGDANMRSVWICSRNDVLGNLAVLAAAGGVFGTAQGWPDILVACIMAVLGLVGGGQIIRQAMAELRSAPTSPA